MRSVRFTYTPSAEIRDDEADALWALYSSSYEAERDAFDRALRKADEVLRFFDADTGTLCGLSFVSAWDATHAGDEFRVIWTGAVLLDPAYRGLNAIQRAGLWCLARERARHPFARLLWFFDTFSVKSYLMLPRNLAEYWPRRDQPTPRWEQGVIDSLCRAAAGDAWDPARGVIGNQGRRLKPGVADAPSDHPDPHVQYFLRSNPQFREGERIPCLVPLTTRNVISIVATGLRRAAGRGRRGSS